MKKEITHTTRGNTLGELQDLIESLVSRVGRDNSITNIESDIERKWMHNAYGEVEAEWHTGTIGIRVFDGDA